MKLEKEFDAAVKEAHQKIKEAIDRAKKAISEAEEIAEKYGVPFSSKVSIFANRVYVPESIKEKWKLEGEALDEALEKLDLMPIRHEWEDDDNCYGWEYWSYSSMHC